MNSTTLIPLSKFLAISGVASRRKATELVKQGQVAIDNQIMRNPAHRINPATAQVTVGDQPIKTSNSLIHIALHKPAGYLSTLKDTHDRPTVLDLVKVAQRVYPVGRLDLDSQGLILLTNDGDLANQLTHPRYHLPKTYEVAVRGRVTKGKLAQLSRGILLEDGKTAPCEVNWLYTKTEKPLQTPHPKAITPLQFVLYEGRKRQIRRMCEHMHWHVETLKRTAIGNLTLGDLKVGEWRELSGDEVEALKNHTPNASPKRSTS